MTLIDRFQGRRLSYNDTITYRSGVVAAGHPDAPEQPATDIPYKPRHGGFTNLGSHDDQWPQNKLFCLCQLLNSH